MSRYRRNRRGVVLIEVVLMFVMLIGFVALTTDYGMMVVRQRRLQNVTDAAAFAAGPALGPETPSSTAIAFATAYRAYNNATGDAPTVAVASTTKTITVTAREDVPTPFAVVLNPAWTSRTVNARSVVRATLGMQDSWLRPLGLMAGQGGISNILNKWLNQPMKLYLRWGSETKRYPDTGRVPADTLWLLPVDLYGGNDVEKYVSALKGSASWPIYWPKRDWLDDMVFYPGDPKQNNDISEQNLWAWQYATYRAIVSDTDSLLNRVNAAGSKFSQDTFMNFQADNPRFVVFLDTNRDTGQERTKPSGYVGFYVEGMDYDPVAHTAAIRGEFIHPVVRSNRLQSTLPSSWENHGLYTYCLIE